MFTLILDKSKIFKCTFKRFYLIKGNINTGIPTILLRYEIYTRVGEKSRNVQLDLNQLGSLIWELVTSLDVVWF